MWPDRVLNPGPLTYESGALPTALCGPALSLEINPSPYIAIRVILEVTELLHFRL